MAKDNLRFAVELNMCRRLERKGYLVCPFFMAQIMSQSFESSYRPLTDVDAYVTIRRATFSKKAVDVNPIYLCGQH